MRLKAILADDEPNILRNLQSVIPWEDLDIEIVGTAKNGMEALELSRRHQPDLVLSDIRMPLMDGIAFVEKLREFNESCEVLMVTGYQDFEYVRSLMRHGASDYILKPINYEELESTIGKIALKIRTKQLSILMKEQKWGMMMNLAYEKILYDVLMDYTTITPKTLLPYDEIDLESLSYRVCLIDLDDYSHKQLLWNVDERKLWNFAVRNVLQDALKHEQLRYVVLQMREGEWCVLIERNSSSELDPSEKISKWVAQLQLEVQRHVKLNVSTGIFPDEVSIHRLPVVYKRLQRMMQLSPNKQQTMLIYKDIKESSDSTFSLWNLVEEIIAGLKQVDRRKTEDALKRLNGLLEALPAGSFVRAAQILHFLILHLLREMREISSIDSAEEEAVWSKLDQSEGIHELLQVMKILVEQGLEGNHKKKNSELLMESAKEYIRKHYSQDFGMEDIADSLRISCSYFSLLFKQHFGETFVEYVTKHRMELAKSMLLLSDKSVTDISKSVGYMERRYFSKVFQKYTGEIPSEFRDKRKAVQ
jgi:two-component system response regulator YesN